MEIQTDVPLKDFSTFGIGGGARYFAVASSKEEMRELLSYASSQKLPFFVLGKGSNCLFDDRGFAGLVILNKIAFCSNEEGTVSVGAGYSFSLLGRQTAKAGWSGLEFACGIPGTLGGAVYMNAGANGQETWDTLVSVDYLHADGREERFFKDQLEHGYRHSAFQKMEGAILGAEFLLKKDDGASARQLALIDYRTKTQPYGDKSCGCIFRNPPGQKSAGALIEGCGLKGQTLGGAQVSSLHANFIVNKQGALACEVLSLIDQVQEKVQAECGVQLQAEIMKVPYDPQGER